MKAAYVREGAAGKWTKIGVVCTACFQVWPLEQTARRRRGGKR